MTFDNYCRQVEGIQNPNALTEYEFRQVEQRYLDYLKRTC